jgi:xanthine/CO dehydrogenase XdhC/CoxF family maturation factor
MDRRETERLLDAIRRARAAGEPAALATIVRVKGNAYRREGTRMFVRRDRSYECALSGGCLEPAVAEAAARVIETGEPAIVAYDLADDSVWGLGIGCTGAVDIRIERVENDALTNEWLGVLERGEAAVLATRLSGAAGRLVVYERGDASGDIGDPAVRGEIVARARRRLADRYPASAAETVGGTEIFFDVATRPPRLVLFGAGYDAAPLARLAWTLGFTVTVVDVRDAFLTPERFPGAALVSAHPGEFPAKVRLERDSFAVIMNHHVERDRESLRFALASDADWIGLLGPRSRYDRLLADLAAGGVVPDAAARSRVRNPVGLALGAETPEEVAVSVLGEILAIRRGFEGGFLDGSVRSLHVPLGHSLTARS